MSASFHSTPALVSAPSGEASPSGEVGQWFTEEVQPHDSQLKSYLRAAFPSVRDVEDIVQETYLRIWKTRATQSIRSAKGFLFHLARHVALDFVRHQRASPIKDVTDLAQLRAFDQGPDAAEAACSREEIALLADAIDTLPARCREIFILRKIHRVPQKEIARRLGLSEQTVQVQVSRGMKRCEEFFARHGL